MYRPQNRVARFRFSILPPQTLPLDFLRLLVKARVLGIFQGDLFGAHLRTAVVMG